MSTPTVKGLLLSQLYAPYQNCSLCPLAFLGRSKVVFGEGNPDAKIIFLGEGPGKDEDEQGRPFVGRSGKLLNQVLMDLGFKREDTYIINVVKCRPPNNRSPLPKEISICKKTLLEKQIKIINPKIICTLGSSALATLIGKLTTPLSKARGCLFFYQSISVLPTYHPSYILRSRKNLPLFSQDIQNAFKMSTAKKTNN